jgi:hypothetical protein
MARETVQSSINIPRELKKEFNRDLIEKASEMGPV